MPTDRTPATAAGRDFAEMLAVQARLVQEYSDNDDNPNVSSYLRNAAPEMIARIEATARSEGAASRDAEVRALREALLRCATVADHPWATDTPAANEALSRITVIANNALAAGLAPVPAAGLPEIEALCGCGHPKADHFPACLHEMRRTTNRWGGGTTTLCGCPNFGSPAGLAIGLRARLAAAQPAPEQEPPVG